MGGAVRIGIFARKDISKGTELSFDYCFEHFGGRPTRCECGSENCRGYLGDLSAVDAIKCEKCNSGEDEDNLLLCECCQTVGSHYYCIGLNRIPEGQNNPDALDPLPP